jgi:hypothetical protein
MPPVAGEEGLTKQHVPVQAALPEEQIHSMVAAAPDNSNASECL